MYITSGDHAAGWGIEELLLYEIYNRWGEKVYENPGDLNQGWDGYYKGELQNMDTYSYVVVARGYAKDENGDKKEISLKGHFELFK